MEPVAHFGLAKNPIVDSIDVAWPDGATATINAPECDRMHVVPHPG
jgi:hypothetical protein